MKRSRSETFDTLFDTLSIVFVLLLGLGIQLSIVGLIVYVIAHFVMKFW